MFRKILLLSVIMLCVCWGNTQAQSQTAKEEIEKMIAEKGLPWVAGETSISHLSDEELEKLCGVKVPPEERAIFDSLNKLPPPPLTATSIRTARTS